MTQGRKLSMYAALAEALIVGTAMQRIDFSIKRSGDDDIPLPQGGYGGDPINTGRRAEKDRIALEKAERKRARKAAKRVRDMQSNAPVHRREASDATGSYATTVERE